MRFGKLLVAPALAGVFALGACTPEAEIDEGVELDEAEIAEPVAAPVVPPVVDPMTAPGSAAFDPALDLNANSVLDPDEGLGDVDADGVLDRDEVYTP